MIVYFNIDISAALYLVPSVLFAHLLEEAVTTALRSSLWEPSASASGKVGLQALEVGF